jgi:hypothetical protein
MVNNQSTCKCANIVTPFARTDDNAKNADTASKLLSNLLIIILPSGINISRLFIGTSLKALIGKEKPKANLPFYSKFMFWKKSVPKDSGPTYYKRVVVAIRLKGNQKLLLKAFKEVPINNLEMLIPDGRIMISKFDKSLLAVSAFFALSSVLAKPKYE